MNPLLLTDFYKPHHIFMYPDGTGMIYSNLTARKSRLPGLDSIVFFGLQSFIKEYLIKSFNENFFNVPLEEILLEYQKHVDLGAPLHHIEKLHNLGYLPIQIKALPEGTICPIGVPCMTIKNTHEDFAWLTNYLETLISCMIWQPITSATIANEYYKKLTKWSSITTGNTDFVQWQAHDFSMRGMSSVESAILSGMAHLAVGFTGTDCIPALYHIDHVYGCKGLLGASVPATEHSVMCAGSKDDELATFLDLLTKYPSGILSVVSDTWDLTKIVNPEHGYLVQLKEEILSRAGKLVIRPDSGDPVEIICGHDRPLSDRELQSNYPEFYHKGLIQCLWEIFGGTTNQGGFKVLDEHIGSIYGDSITLERCEQICQKLYDKGFASTNIVFGVGSFTYQYNTRDTFGFAIKATAVKINGELRPIFKDPITDDGTKKSAKGFVRVERNDQGKLVLLDDQTEIDETKGTLKTVFINGDLIRSRTFDEIRETVKRYRYI